MLRRADNVRLTHRPGFWTGKGPGELAIGRKFYVAGRFTTKEFAELQAAQQQFPARIARVGQRNYWQFQDRFYWENDELRADQIHALLVTRDQRRLQQIDRAQATLAMGATPRSSPTRRSIPDDIKQYIWTRDGGSCRACGSTAELQYDHIIPLAMGGSNNSENLQILCGPCNRSKSAGLTTRR